jgi:hypothetical protein
MKLGRWVETDATFSVWGFDLAHLKAPTWPVSLKSLEETIQKNTKLATLKQRTPKFRAFFCKIKNYIPI